jgi:1,4-alpha-glucan branching enzyme
MTSIGKDGSVEFWFFRRDVNDVRIVGDFETPVSSAGGVAMTAGPDGWWRATVALAAGEYRFRYVADGVWYTDYASNGVESSKLGLSSILVVPDSPGHAAQQDTDRMVA